MSPEQIDAAAIDGRSDLYCLGLILYEMLSGRAPFESASPRELLNKQCTEAPPPLPDQVRRGLPRGVERLVFELLEKAPDDRPGTAGDVLHELEPFAPASAGLPPAARPSAPRTQPSATSAEPAPAVSRKDTPPSEPRAALPRPPANDTIALLERATSEREVSPRNALLVIVALSLVAGLITYAVRSSSGPEDARESPSASAPLERAEERR
jgi:serine/threonine-protein kinase